MADGVDITPGIGATVLTDDTGGTGHAQVVKLAISTDGSATLIPAEASNGLDVDVTRVQGSVAVTDNSGSLTVDAPIGTPVNVQIGNATLAAGVIDETGASAVDALAVGGGTANDAVDSGNPLKIGGKAISGVPTPVAANDRVNAWLDLYGRLTMALSDPDLGNTVNLTSLRDLQVAQRYTMWFDSLADGISAAWTQSVANGGTVTNTGGEGLLKTSTATNGSSQIVSPTINYFAGRQEWFNSAIRTGDTGVSGNIRRWGKYTVSGTTPQDGFYYELSGTTLNAVTCKGGSATAVAVGSWTLNGTNPFTLDANFHQWEIRYTANTAWFLIDGILRHVAGGSTAAPLTNTLSLPISATNVKTSGATDITLGIRNIGTGGFGQMGSAFMESGTNALAAQAVGGGTPHDSVDSGNPIKVGARAIAHGTNPTAVAAADRTDLLANRAGIPFYIGGHPNIVTVKHTTITTAVTDAAVITVGSGVKIVVTSFMFTLDNASTVFPTVLLGFGTANTPTTTGVIGAHGGVPAGGGFGRGDGSGIIGIGADNEDLRVTTTGNATGNGLQLVVTYFTIES